MSLCSAISWKGDVQFKSFSKRENESKLFLCFLPPAMAAASGIVFQGLCEEAICPICLEYFKDPVTIECGHNFCRACLTQCWEGSEGEEVSCPQCREKVGRILIPNRQLANIVELTKKLCLQEKTRTEGKWRVCGKHQEPLKLFCKDDESPICVVCDRSKEHRDHDVVLLEEAALQYKDVILTRLDRMMEEKARIVKYKDETEKESNDLLIQTKAKIENMKAAFRKLHQILEEQEKLLLAQLEEVEKEIARKRDEHLARLSRELSSLGGLIREMEEKHQQPPGELLQDVRSLLQSCEKKETFQNSKAFLHELKWKMWGVCDRNPFLDAVMEQFRANVTLDPSTAHPRLFLSVDCKNVRCEGMWQDVPSAPERFDGHFYVLGCEGFRAGRHYWEVIVGRGGIWAVGVARKSVQRKGFVGLETKEGIWALGRWEGGYRASDVSVETCLPLSEKLRRIWVSLKYEEGQVAFHDADMGSHLYTFTGASFSGETLLPFFYVAGKGPLTISP
uniref:E3 ubiquitin-protein ligase TRIM39-like isoform X2 n=1 Tax=Pogona vitticeps TaxID=103695 RepID=A0ABM5FHE1_9SAUR